MKIIIDGTTIAHGSRAGRRHSKNLIETLVRIDDSNDYKILYIDKNKQMHRYANLPDKLSVSQHIIPFPERIFRFAWEKFAMPTSESLLGNFDVFYAPGFYFPPAKRGSVLGTIHGIAYKIIEDKFATQVVKELNKGLDYTLRYADYFLAVSKKTKEEFVGYSGIEEDRVYVVTHGVDPRFRCLRDRQALLSRLSSKFKFRPQYILYVGDIGHHKNVMGLLEAYSMGRKNGINIPLVMAGPKGSAWEEAHNWISRKQMEGSIHLIGPVEQDNNDLTDLYNGADLFVFPSFYEGWTAPPLEAMACGVPVITSNCSSLPETVGQAAIQVDPSKPEKIAIEMQRVLSDDQLKSELRKKGTDHAASHSWDRAARNLLDVFNDISRRGPVKR